MASAIRISQLLRRNASLSVLRLPTQSSTPYSLQATSRVLLSRRGYATATTPLRSKANEEPKSSSSSGGQSKQHQQEKGPEAEQERVLYERKPEWYIRLIPLLIVLDIAMFVNFAELVVNHWTEPVVPDSDSESSRTSTSSSTPTEPVLKPAWKRYGTAGAAIALSSGVAALLLVVRGRVIRRIVILPPSLSANIKSRAQRITTSMTEPSLNVNVRRSVPMPTVLIQTVEDMSVIRAPWKWGSKASSSALSNGQRGMEVWPDAAQWGKGRDPTELFVSLPPRKGRFGLTLKDATIMGKTGGSVEENRTRFEEAWVGLRAGGGRWKPLIPVDAKVESYYA